MTEDRGEYELMSDGRCKDVFAFCASFQQLKGHSKASCIVEAAVQTHQLYNRDTNRDTNSAQYILIEIRHIGLIANN
jgi:hypothetical protein